MAGTDLIRIERDEQTKKHKYSDQHDDQHIDVELARAALWYLVRYVVKTWGDIGVKLWLVNTSPWPWDNAHPQQKDLVNDIEMLSKSGALIAAEIDRLIRKEQKNNG